MTLTASVTAEVSASATKTSGLHQATAAMALRLTLALGTAAGADGAADAVAAASHTVAAGGSTTLDLAGGVADGFGGTVAFTSVSAVMVKAAAANDGAVSVGGGSNPFASPFGDATDAVRVLPGGCLLLAAPGGGYAVTADTGDTLTLTNAGAAPATVEVVVIGATA